MLNSLTDIFTPPSRMMNDMTTVANSLGGYLPGSEPQFMVITSNTLALIILTFSRTYIGTWSRNAHHCKSRLLRWKLSTLIPTEYLTTIQGTTRVGSDSKTSVANPCSKVWGFSNLWVGGNNVIPDSTASNPTLTSVRVSFR